jgi:hypothetical protein
MLLALLLAAAPDAGALPSAFAATVFTADALVEIEVPLKDPMKKPARRWSEGLVNATPVRVVASRAALPTPPSLKAPQWEVPARCLVQATTTGTVRALLVAHRDPPGYSLLPLAGEGLGLASTAGYAQLVAAVVEVFHWHEERMRAVGAEQLWLAQKKALRSANPYLRHLAAGWLQQHDAAEVVDLAWGQPGTPERVANEAKAAIAPNC